MPHESTVEQSSVAEDLTLEEERYSLMSCLTPRGGGFSNRSWSEKSLESMTTSNRSNTADSVPHLRAEVPREVTHHHDEDDSDDENGATVNGAKQVVEATASNAKEVGGATVIGAREAPLPVNNNSPTG